MADLYTSKYGSLRTFSSQNTLGATNMMNYTRSSPNLLCSFVVGKLPL